MYNLLRYGTQFHSKLVITRNRGCFNAPISFLFLYRRDEEPRSPLANSCNDFNFARTMNAESRYSNFLSRVSSKQSDHEDSEYKIQVCLFIVFKHKNERAVKFSTEWRSPYQVTKAPIEKYNKSSTPRKKFLVSLYNQTCAHALTTRNEQITSFSRIRDHAHLHDPALALRFSSSLHKYTHPFASRRSHGTA